MLKRVRESDTQSITNCRFSPNSLLGRNPHSGFKTVTYYKPKKYGGIFIIHNLSFIQFYGVAENFLRHSTNHQICFHCLNVTHEKQAANEPDNSLSPNHG